MILIENDIIFLSVPKNASMSVHFALEESDFKIEPTFNQDHLIKVMLEQNPDHYRGNKHKIKVHAHYTTATTYSFLKRKLPTIFIKRDYLERFLSAVNYIFNFRIPLAYPELLDTLEIVDNNWLYKNFNKDIINSIIRYDPIEVSTDIKTETLEDKVHKHIISSLKKYVKKNIKIETLSPFKEPFPKNKYINFKMLDSQEIYKSGYEPKYIFDINELDKLEEFLLSKYEKKIEIKKINEMDKKNIKTNLIKDNKLKNWVWDNFEKHHFVKKLF